MFTLNNYFLQNYVCFQNNRYKVCYIVIFSFRKKITNNKSGNIFKILKSLNHAFNIKIYGTLTAKCRFLCSVYQHKSTSLDYQCFGHLPNVEVVVAVGGCNTSGCSSLSFSFGWESSDSGSGVEFLLSLKMKRIVKLLKLLATLTGLWEINKLNKIFLPLMCGRHAFFFLCLHFFPVCFPIHRTSSEKESTPNVKNLVLVEQTLSF